MPVYAEIIYEIMLRSNLMSRGYCDLQNVSSREMLFFPYNFNDLICYIFIPRSITPS